MQVSERIGSFAVATPLPASGPAPDAPQNKARPASCDGVDAPVAADSPAKKAELDANRVKQAADVSPANGAAMLEGLLKDNRDPVYQAKLIDETKPTLAKMASEMSKPRNEPVAPSCPGQPPPNSPAVCEKAMKSLAEAAKAAGPQGAQGIADALASGIPSYKAADAYGHQVSNLTEPLSKSIASTGSGVALGVALGKAFDAQKMPEAAANAKAAVASGIKTAVASFEAASQGVETLNGKLGQLLGGPAGALNDAQLTAAIEQFKSSTEYQAAANAREAAAAPLIAAMQEGGPSLNDAGLLGQLPNLAETKKGSDFIADEVTKQGQNQPSILDQLDAPAWRDHRDMTVQLAGAIGKSVALRAVSLAANGNKAGSAELFKGLAKNSGVFGLPKAEMEKVAQGLAALKPGMTAKQLADATKNLKETVGKMAADVPGGKAIKGLSLVLGAVAAGTELSKLSKSDLGEQVKAIGDTINVTGDAAAFAAEVFGKSASWLGKAKVLGPIGTAITALGDGIQSMQFAAGGKWDKAGAHGLEAAGGFLMAAGALSQSVPGAGTLVGGVLLGAGMAWEWGIDLQEKAQFRQEQVKLLEAACLPKELIGTLLDAPPERLRELREGLGLSAETVQRLGLKEPWLLTHAGPGASIQLGTFNEICNTFGVKGESAARLLEQLGAGADGALHVQDLTTTLDQLQVPRPASPANWRAAIEKAMQQVYAVPLGRASEGQPRIEALRMLLAYLDANGRA